MINKTISHSSESKMKESTEELPPCLKGVLWSYDLKQLDVQKDFKRIATNILVYGYLSTNGELCPLSWLFQNFTREEIKSVITDPLKGEWDAKSLAFWTQHFRVTTDKEKALKNFVDV